MKPFRKITMNKRRKYLATAFIGIGCLFIIAAAMIASDKPSVKTQTSQNNKNVNQYYKVTAVIDGDTIKLDNGWTIRYLDIDTPETHSPKVAPQCFGQEAANYNKQLIGDKQVRLVSDVNDKDQYGRRLRYVFTKDGTFANYELVSKGYAQVSVIPPDNLMYKTFLDAQNSAVKNHFGLWAKCLTNKGG